MGDISIKYNCEYLGVINNPNTLGVGCNYVDNGVIWVVAVVKHSWITQLIFKLILQTTPTFTVTSPVCVAIIPPSPILVTAGAGATYSWDFDGGNVVSGIGKGPYQVNWAAGGITLY